MLCGCPVIGRPEVLVEILPSERCGVHLPSSQPSLWAESITRALEGDWSKAEIHTLSQVFTWEVLGNEFERIYGQMII